MTQDNEIQPGVRINESLWNEFRDDIQQRRGGVRGHLRTELENAIRSYLEASKGGDINDRLRRIENRMEEMGEGVDTLVDDSQRKKNKDSGVSSTVKNRLEKIESQIDREAADSPYVHESAINAAIEDHAGSSRPTLDRYKEMLQDRHIAHKWPKEDSRRWFVDVEQWAQMVDNTFGYDVVEEIEHEFGRDWFDAQVETEEDESSGKGFQ